MNKPLSLPWLTTNISSLTNKRLSQHSSLPFLLTFCLLLALLPLTTAAQVVVTSIQRNEPSNAITNANELTFRVTFDKPVSRVDTGDFSLSGDGAGGASINTVMAVSASVYDVSISGITNNNGTVNLNIKGVGGVSGTNNIAYTDEALNVSNLDHEALYGYGFPIVGIPFTPTTSGLITFVTLFKSPLSTYAGQATIEILTGEGLNGAVLASQTVAVTSGSGELSVAFSTPASVASGTKYTLKISGGTIENRLYFRRNDGVYPELLYDATGFSSIIDLLFKIFIGSYSVPLSTTGPTTNETYTLDNVAPVVTGVANNGLYNNDRTITFNEGSATLNGAAFTSGSKISANGNCILIVTDAASNSTTVQFTLDKITLNTVDKLSEKEDITVNFSSSEFTNAFSSIGGSLTKIKITSLPDASTGVLKLGTNNVTLNQEILAADLSTLTFVPAANYNGSASFKWNGTEGSIYAETDAAVDITLAAVNDAPSFTKGADQLVNEDAGMQMVTGWATAISTGPANESAQTIDFVVTNTNPVLFADQPAITEDGTLAYTPAANAFGSATVRVKIKDNGGTANGGVDESALQTFTITVQGTRTVTGLTPQRNAVAAPVATHITATASDPFPNTASTKGSIHVFSRQAGGKKAGTATVSGNTITFDPAAYFKHGETVFTTLTTASGLAKAQVYQFTTAAAPASGSFSGATNVTVGDQPVSVVAADVDGDADLDILTANVGSDNVSVRLNNGSGSFSGSTNIAVGILTSSVAAADVDGDGDLDILAASSFNGTVSVRLNDGAGTFSGTTNVPVGASPLSVVAADVDGDGDLDILAANRNSNNVSVRLNNGSGAFSGSTEVAVGLNPTSVAAADVDRDGDLDILAANTSDDNVSVRLNNGSGSFTGTTDVAVGSSPRSVVAADVDGDGDLDILVANLFNGTVSVRLNDGAGAFSGTAQVAVGVNPYSVAVADVDGDGDLDILTANSSSNNVSVRLNDGAGSFSNAANVVVENYARSVTAADVDGDGDLDILCANQSDDNVSVRLNGPKITLNDFNKPHEKEDVAVSFNAADFTNAISNGSLSKVKITSLPSASTGVLKVNAIAVKVDQEIPLADLATLTFEPARDYNGSASFKWNGSDGSVYAANNATVHITLAPVNDAPNFTIAHDPATVNEDAGAQTVPNFATSLTDGDPEVDQPLSFTIIGNNNQGLFSVAPVIANDGTLTYTPAANANGTALIKVTLSDNGSALDPDANTSEEKTFTITVNAVNDAPGFTKGADQRVSEDAGPQIVGNWATSISKGPANESAQTIEFVVTNNNNGLFSTQPAISDDGSLTYTPAAHANGSATVGVKITDNGGTANGGVNESAIQTFTITLTAVNDAPVVLATPSTQQVQYSDPIASVRIAATDVDNSLNQLNATSSWKLASAVSFSSGLPSDLAFTKMAEGSWSLSGKMMVAPGTYTVRVTVNDGTADAGNNFGYTDIEIVVVPEDARVTYTGALFASTSGTTSGKATVTLSATIQDITAVLGDGAYDINAGDIRNAKVKFVNRDNGSDISGWLTPGLVTASDLKTGTVTFNWAIDIGSKSYETYTVGIVVNNYYTRNASLDNTTVNVSKPLSDFITGGGFITLTNASGLIKPKQGTKNNFGFNVKYNKGGTNLQGNINTIVRGEDGQVYQVKGNVMTSLSVNSTNKTAVFNGKANIQDITNPLVPLSVDGNATLQVTMTDMGEPGSSDKIAITVWNKAGGLWLASHWNGAKTLEQLLTKGNLKVSSKSSFNTTPSTTARIDLDNSIDTEPSPQVIAYPNPVLDKVTIDLGGIPAMGVKTLLTDAVGKPLLENGHKVIGESLLEIDMSGLKSAMYIIQLRSERAYKIVKVIKQ